MMSALALPGSAPPTPKPLSTAIHCSNRGLKRYSGLVTPARDLEKQVPNCYVERELGKSLSLDESAAKQWFHTAQDWQKDQGNAEIEGEMSQGDRDSGIRSERDEGIRPAGEKWQEKQRSTRVEQQVGQRRRASHRTHSDACDQGG